MSDFIGFFKIDSTGSPVWKDKKQMEKFISMLPVGKYIFKISPFSEKRSINQNKYYWKLIEIIASQIGYEVEEMHQVFKYKFLKKTFEDANGNLVKGLQSTNELSVYDFTIYINNIKKYCQQDLNLILPDSFE